MILFAAGPALAAAASAAPASGTQPHPALRTHVSSSCSGQEGEILVCGRRDGRKYRIAPEPRTRNVAATDQRRAATDLQLNCRNIGPQGCGTELLPIVTVSGDGSIAIGQKR